jgi:hypothetical protein
VFELVHGAHGQWSLKVLYGFKNDGKDGYSPLGGVVFDTQGNLYGITYYGGEGTCTDGANGNGCGTVFELKHNADNTWSEKVLYSFKNDGKDAVYPQASLIFDKGGNLYGTSNGGANRWGAIFKMKPGSNETWSESVLFSFNDFDGGAPQAPLVFDGKGNLYSTTEAGGAGRAGTVFELTP